MKRYFTSIMLLGALGLPAGAQSPKPYKVLSSFTLPGTTGWDYLTASHGRLYITRGQSVQIVNESSGKLVGTLPKTTGVHGVALDPAHHRGYCSDGGEDKVMVFDIRSLAETTRIPVGSNPDAIIFDSKTHRVFTANGKSSDLTAVDTSTNKVVGTVPVGGKPEFMAVDGQGHLYVNIEDKSEVLQVDTATLQVKAHWPLAPGEEPTGLAIDTAKGRLFSTCHNGKMIVLDCKDGHHLAEIPIGQGTDAAAYDPGTHCAFSSNGRSANLSVAHEDKPGQFTATDLPTEAGARTMALDPDTHRIYLVTATPVGQEKGRKRIFKEGSFKVLVVGQ